MTAASFTSILHPTDFSAASDLAFAHALKLALLTRAHFDVVHTELPDREGIDWAAFPGVRNTLERWGLLPAGSRPGAVAEQLGMRVRKVDVVGRDPVEGVVRFINEHPCDLLVLATHGRGGWQRWRKGSIAEPIARRAHTPTLFLPHGARGFVDPERGEVSLRRILIAVDHDPRPEAAITEAWRLAKALEAEDVSLHALYVGAAGDAPPLHAMPEVGARVEPIARQGAVVERIVQTATELDADLPSGRYGIEDEVPSINRSSTVAFVMFVTPAKVATCTPSLPCPSGLTSSAVLLLRSTRATKSFGSEAPGS